MSDDLERREEGAEDPTDVTSAENAAGDGGGSAREAGATGHEGEDSPDWLEIFYAEKAQRRIKKIHAEDKWLHRAPTRLRRHRTA